MMEKDKSVSNKKEKKFSFNASELKKNVLNQGSAYSWPMGLWFIIFFIVPLVIIFVYSFMKKGLYGGVEAEFSLQAYKQMLNIHNFFHISLFLLLVYPKNFFSQCCNSSVHCATWGSFIASPKPCSPWGKTCNSQETLFFMSAFA